MLAIQRAGQDFGFDDVDQRIDHRARCAPLVDDRGDRFGSLRIAAADVFFGTACAGVRELRHQIAQAAHLLAFQCERRQVGHTLHHPEWRSGKRLAAQRRQAVFDEQIELQAMRIAIPVQLLGERHEMFVRAGITVGEQDAPALAAVEITTLLIPEEQQRRDHRGTARHRGFVFVLVENLCPALVELRVAVQMPQRDHRRQRRRSDGDWSGGGRGDHGSR